MDDDKKTKWSWLLWLPLAGIAFPFLLFAGPALQALLMGPVNIWNSTNHAPPDTDLAGFYQVSETDRESLRNSDVFISDQSGFKLSADHTLQVIDLPTFD